MTFPSHVKDNDVLGAVAVIQDGCVEADSPPCTFKYNSFLFLFCLFSLGMID